MARPAGQDILAQTQKQALKTESQTAAATGGDDARVQRPRSPPIKKRSHCQSSDNDGLTFQ